MRHPNETSGLDKNRAVRVRSIMALRQEHGDRDHPVCSRAEYDEVRDQLRVVQEENCKLQAIITDVTAVNKRWQKYNNDRQMYVQGLLATIQELQDHVNTTVGQQVFTSKDGGTRVALLQQQVDELQRQLASVERQHREHMQVLELQLKSYRDDWEAEHEEKQVVLQDKLRAERHACELELELRCLRRKLEAHCGQGATKHCECCRLSSESTHASGYTSKTYRTSAQLPTALEDFQSYNDDLKVDGNKQRGKSDSCTGGPVVVATPPEGVRILSEGHTSEHSCSQQSGAKFLQLTSPADCASKLNVPVRDNVAMLNVVHKVPRCDRNTSAVTIGFTSDGRAAVTTFANFPVRKSTSLPAEQVSEQAAAISTSASGDISHLTSWLPSLDIATPPRSVDIPEKSSCPPEPSGRGCKANYYEEGIATQTKENIICPGCGHVFPPKHQLDFLDHFELCQSQ